MTFPALREIVFTYDRGVSDYYVPHRLVLGLRPATSVCAGEIASWQPPLEVNPIINGWQLDDVKMCNSGQYSTPVLSSDTLNISSFSQSRLRGLSNVCFCRFGSQIARAAGYQNWNTSLFKNLSIRERPDFQLRFEAFNHTQFEFANSTVGSGFGVISSVRPSSARVVQLDGISCL